MNIIPFIDEHYWKTAFIDYKISITQLDYSRQQTLEEFKEISRPSIVYNSNDCLIAINDIKLNQLKSNQWINLSSVEQIGWYSKDKHYNNEKALTAIDPHRFDKIINENPSIKIACFELLHRSKRELRELSVLAGGLGLCYFKYRQDYDSLFSKIEVVSNRWCISRKLLNPKNDYTVLLQLFLLENGNHKSIQSLLDNESDSYRINYRLLYSSFQYFVSKQFTAEGYFKLLNDEFGSDEKSKAIGDEFRLLYEEYVRKGIEIRKLNPLTNTVRRFIDLAKNEIPDLFRVLSTDAPVSKTSLFLLGMYHSSEYLEKQFEFRRFIPSFIEVLSRGVEDITVNNEDIEIQFRKEIIDAEEGNKFQFLNNYINAIKHLDKNHYEYLDKLSEKRLLDGDLQSINREIQILNEEVGLKEITLRVNEENRKVRVELEETYKRNELLTRDLQSLRGQNTEIVTEMERKNNEIMELQSTVTKRDETIRSLNEKINVQSDDIKGLHLRISSFEDTIRKLQINITKLNHVVGNLKLESDNLKVDLEEVTNRSNNLLNVAENQLEHLFKFKHWIINVFKKNAYNEMLSKERERLRELLRYVRRSH